MFSKNIAALFWFSLKIFYKVLIKVLESFLLIGIPADKLNRGVTVYLNNISNNWSWYKKRKNSSALNQKLGID